MPHGANTQQRNKPGNRQPQQQTRRKRQRVWNRRTHRWDWQWR